MSETGLDRLRDKRERKKAGGTNRYESSDTVQGKGGRREKGGKSKGDSKQSVANPRKGIRKRTPFYRHFLKFCNRRKKGVGGENTQRNSKKERRKKGVSQPITLVSAGRGRGTSASFLRGSLQKKKENRQSGEGG